MHAASSDFVLRGGDAAFANRQKLLFDQLSIAESRCNVHERAATDDDGVDVVGMHAEADRSSELRRPTSGDSLKRKRETKRFRGRESIFKRPEGPAPRANFRRVPDYHRNPHKWVRYSLSDVSSEDMTDRSNTQAAMSFLRELKARRTRQETDEREEEEEEEEEEERMDVESCEPHVKDRTETLFKFKKRTSTSEVVFRKPPREAAESSEAVVIKTDEKPVFRSSKIILPEYVVGERPKKIRKRNRPAVKVDRSKELRLDHLEEPDEEEDN